MASDRDSDRTGWLGRARAVPLAALGLSLLVVGPLLGRGYVLTFDMVFTPRPPLTGEMFGLSSTFPRAVPTALVVALLSRVLTGQVLQKLVLAGIFFGAAYGAAGLVPSKRPAARVASGVLYAWNPFTYERLLMGQWALLVGYASLPWVAKSAVRVRRGEPASLAKLALALGATAVAGPYTGLIGAALAMAMVMVRPRDAQAQRDVHRGRGAIGVAVVVIAVAVALNLPWAVPAVLHPGVPQSPALATALFRARSDSPLGTLGSLVSLGGFWRTDLAPPGRTSGVWIPAFVLISAFSVAGWKRLAARWPAGARRGLLGVAVASVILAAAPSLPLLGAVARWMGALPGGGILRESQKFVMPAAVALAVAFGLGVEALVERSATGSPWIRGMAVAPALLPLALAPTLAWGAGGKLSPARYPSSWADVERVISGDPIPGAVLALPWHAYLPLSWNHERTVHQPAGQYFSRRVVQSASLEVGSYQLPQEEAYARLAAGVATGTGPMGPSLTRLGIRYVVLFKEADWRPAQTRLQGLSVVVRSPDLTLYRAPPPGPEPRLARPPVVPVVAGDVIAALVIAGAGVLVARDVAARRWGR